MMNYKSIALKISSIAIVALVGAMMALSCVKVDDTLGSDYIPGDQEFDMGRSRFEQLRNKIEVRLFQTDSVISNNVNYGYFGTSQNDTMGQASAGFMTQFIYSAPMDSLAFGYRPIIDSVLMLISIDKHGLDTLTPQRFEVYEITSNDYLTESKGDDEEADSIFYLSFDPTKYVGNEPLFTFTFPEADVSNPASTFVKLHPTTRGWDYVRKMTISDGAEKDPKYYSDGVYYSIYKDYGKWLETFKGLYIKPVSTSDIGAGSGSIYGTKLSASGLALYTRSRNRVDPTLIQDTVIVGYPFYNSDLSYYEDYNPAGNQSINMIKHDFSNAQFDINDVNEQNTNRPLSDVLMVSGMGGVISELTITEEMFEALQELIDEQNNAAVPVENYTSIAFNQAKLRIYFSEADHDWQQIDPMVLTPIMDGSLPRFGAYTDYVTMKNIVDYNYIYETQYEIDLPYDGSVNRSRGCYVLDISGYLQELWAQYHDLKAESKDGKVDISEIENRTFYLGPEVTEMFTYQHSTAQGVESSAGKVNSMELEFIYTLVK